MNVQWVELACGHSRLLSGSMIEQVQRGERRVWCSRCDKERRGLIKVSVK